MALTGCATHTDAAKSVVPVSVRSTTTTTAARPVIDESTLRRLAAIAQSAAARWSEPHPWGVRVALGSQSGAEAIGVAFAYGETSPRPVYALEGYLTR